MRLIALIFITVAFSTTASAEDDVCPKLPEHTGLKWVQSGMEDFVVCSAKAEGRKQEAFAIYLGNHPDFKPDPSRLIGSGQVGGKPITWYRMGSGAGQGSREGLVSLGKEGWAQVAHVWFSAADPKEAKRILSVLARIRFRANAL